MEGPSPKPTRRGILQTPRTENREWIQVPADVLNTPGHVLLFDPGNKFSIMFKILPLLSWTLVRTQEDSCPRDTRAYPPPQPLRADTSVGTDTERTTDRPDSHRGRATGYWVMKGKVCLYNGNCHSRTSRPDPTPTRTSGPPRSRHTQGSETSPWTSTSAGGRPLSRPS